MTENFKRIFLDTSPIIYFFDENSIFREKSAKILDTLLIQNCRFVTSAITCMEYLVLPYRKKIFTAIDNFWKFLDEYKVAVCKIDNPIAVKAAQIRAEYVNFKAMDSLQLAVACLSDCDLFLTNDKQLKNFKEIPCATVEEWSFTE